MAGATHPPLQGCAPSCLTLVEASAPTHREPTDSGRAGETGRGLEGITIGVQPAVIERSTSHVGFCGEVRPHLSTRWTVGPLLSSERQLLWMNTLSSGGGSSPTCMLLRAYLGHCPI